MKKKTVLCVLFLAASIATNASAAIVDVPGIPNLQFVDEGENSLTFVKVVPNETDPDDKDPKDENPKKPKKEKKEKEKLEIEFFNHFAAGPGVSGQTGSVKSARFQTHLLHYDHFQDGSGFVLQDFQTIDYNVYNWENRDARTGTALEGQGNIFMGYSFNAGEQGTDFYIGGSGDVRKGIFAYGTVGGTYSAAVGLEGGIHYQDKYKSLMFSPQVSIGGKSCVIEMDDGTQRKIKSNGVGLGGIARGAFGKRTIAQVLYMAYPGGKQTPKSAVPRQAAKQLSFDLFVNFGKITLSGQCEISHWEENDWTSTAVKVGILRTFGK